MPRHLLAAEEPPQLAAGPEPAPAPFPLAATAGDADVRPPRPLMGSIVASCAMHVAAAAALLTSVTALPEFGVLQNPSETFSLSTTQTVVLESIVTEAVATTAAASAAMPEGTVQSVDAEPEPLKADDDAPVETEPPPQAIKAAEVTPEAAETPEERLDVVRGSGEPAETVEAKPEPAQEQESQEQAEREERSKKRRELAQRQRSQRQIAGGPPARASAATAAVSGRVSGSRGSALSYGARVRSKVTHNKPASRGQRGVARVSFGVSPAGELSYAELSASSGNTALDDAALAAVRRSAPFGTPPPDLLPNELRFSIRITYR